MKLTARETSLLAFIAQKPRANDPHVKKVMAELRGDAKRVAEALLSQNGRKSAARTYADRLRQWAKSLGK